MNYAVKWEWNRHCDQSAGQKVKSGAPISSLSPYNPVPLLPLGLAGEE